MLAALRGQPDAVFGQHRRDAGIDGLCGFQAAVLADVPADDLAGRAAHDKDIAFAQPGLRQKFGHGLPCLGFDLLFECFCHYGFTSYLPLRAGPAASWHGGPARFVKDRPGPQSGTERVYTLTQCSFVSPEMAR